MLTTHSVKKFIDILASNAPAPGGGSVSALNGALAAGLISMVCQLSLSHKELAVYEIDIKKVLDQTLVLKEQLVDLIDKDTQAFNGVMMAYRMKKSTPEQFEERSQAIQSAFKEAVNIPLLIATRSSEVLNLAVMITKHFNTNTASDMGVGAYCAMVGIRGALMNVDINLSSIKDKVFVDKIQTSKNNIIKNIDQQMDIVYQAVTKIIT